MGFSQAFRFLTSVGFGFGVGFEVDCVVGFGFIVIGLAKEEVRMKIIGVDSVAF